MLLKAVRDKSKLTSTHCSRREMKSSTPSKSGGPFVWNECPTSPPKKTNLPIHAHLRPLNKPSFPSSHLDSNRADMLRHPSERKLTSFQILLLRSLQESYVPLYFSKSPREAKKQTRLQRYLNSSFSGNNLTPTGVSNLLFFLAKNPDFTLSCEPRQNKMDYSIGWSQLAHITCRKSQPKPTRLVNNTCFSNHYSIKSMKNTLESVFHLITYRSCGLYDILFALI